ncbi:MobV family relaxase [Streptomyces fungicidicus]|uniref:MobV family relaxase n=1 Tax=Streptomyces fungicidicus TaxID=68203 RepID=UPI0036557568
MSYAVVRMQKMKAHDLKGIQFHNQRERESRTNSDIDKERSHENYDLVHDGKIDYNQHVKEIIESQKTGTRKTRKDAVLVNELLVTSDKNFFDRLDPTEQKRFFEESYKLFSERYGEQNIAYATVHMDEKTPHMHVGFVPMRDGKLQGKNVFNRQELLWLQDKFPEHMQKLGFDLERGEKGSTREHLETREFKKQTLEKEIDFLEKNLQEKKNELLALNEKVPDEIKVRAKREFQQIEVKSEEKNLFGIPKKELKKTPTGNVIVPEQDFKNLVHAAKENKQLKGKMEKILNTDLAKENKALGQKLRVIYKEWETEANSNKKLRQENMQLLRENSKLKSHISDLKREIGLIYKSTKEFLKARTNDLKTFKSLFNDLVGKIKEKAPEGEFERLNRVEKRRERENGLER